ncbi:25-hydroxycholesterol 7-alpha-hydroxylase [Apiospora arundinis]|uniref:25-hydroxycholesterol 7-alpha-hydroxylase n=1 Tax=Apiospora arundinis TaxID=335852 RepID=A0ABR2HZM7_9PEZI
MSVVNETAAHAQGLLQGLSPWYSAVLLPLALLLVLQPWTTSKNEPPSMRATIPYISNGYQFLANKPLFFKRLEKYFKKASIIRFNLGPKIAYMVSGANNIQNLFRSGQGISDDTMLLTAAKSGRSKIPKSGYENVPYHERYWALHHDIYEKYLTSKEFSDASANKYFEVFSERLDTKFPVGGGWTTLSLSDMFRVDMAHCAITTLMGEKILELNPGFIDKYWALERYLAEFLVGLPKWLNPRPYRVRDEMTVMTLRWARSAWENFDWDGPDADTAWDPHFGSRVMREISRWWTEHFAFEGQSGFFATLLLAQNSNTIPACMWSMLHLIEDPELYQAVRDEVATAITVDPATNAPTLDPQAISNLPLLNALYMETLRFHVTFNIMREVSEDTQMDGYELKKGAWLQASTQIAHHDESLWARDGHPASEFWIGRFLEYEDKTEVVDKASGEKKTTRVPKFNGTTRPGSWFPYGGGAAMCPGRQFARLEILVTVALLVSKFDIEFLEWTFKDGCKSDRPGRPDESELGSGVLKPDRDMKVRWKRLW